MDREGMGIIESHETDKFYEYWEKTKNTICGRNPISVFMEICR